MVRARVGIGVVMIAVAAIVALQSFTSTSSRDQGQQAAVDGGALVEIKLPEQLSANAVMGQRSFDAVCVACHGQNAVGQDGLGPPLVHKIYEPGHHADEAFQRAVKLGVRSHHWGFGDMAPVDGFTRADVKMIVTYIRELQRANGIF